MCLSVPQDCARGGGLQKLNYTLFGGKCCILYLCSSLRSYLSSMNLAGESIDLEAGRKKTIELYDSFESCHFSKCKRFAVKQPCPEFTKAVTESWSSEGRSCGFPRDIACCETGRTPAQTATTGLCVCACVCLRAMPAGPE